MSGLALVYGADKEQALCGDKVNFTAWVINETNRPVELVTLVPGAFTNEGLDNLTFTVPPTPAFLSIGGLEPGHSAERRFSYTVTLNDTAHGGTLISSMRVWAVSGHESLYDEHDATIAVLPQ
ncbi:hypothetical protein [Arthrobacter sp. 31Y]|uniref:hypothetical protein n=1 Tax=Arthrobacter sp. 31Y TaxID=1115632 RepID=UPI0004679710|nr:hypothetical protein [Arthrobacter sp. 31Y]